MRTTPPSTIATNEPYARTALGSALLVAMTTLIGCKPDLGAADSLITGPTIIAVRGEPAEVAPGSSVTFTALAVGPQGVLAAVPTWTLCESPKPPADNNAVARACVTTPDIDAPSATLTTPLPSDACTLFGPLTPVPKPGEPPFRPRDPDSTGGYYFPARAAFRAAGDKGQDLLGFALERISCGLVNAPGDVVRDFTAMYKPNARPKLAGLTATTGGTAMDVPALTPGVAPAALPSGEHVTFSAAFTPDSAESFPVFDLQSRTLVTARESLQLSWYATAGDFDSDRTGRSSADFTTSSDNAWTAPIVTVPTVVHVWLVLTDNRGGVDFAGYDVSVAP